MTLFLVSLRSVSLVSVALRHGFYLALFSQLADDLLFQPLDLLRFAAPRVLWLQLLHFRDVLLKRHPAFYVVLVPEMGESAEQCWSVFAFFPAAVELHVLLHQERPRAQ